jgi:hypothetical protein
MKHRSVGRGRRPSSRGEPYPRRPMSRGAGLSLYALLVLIWSSTWVAIKIGLEDAGLLPFAFCYGLGDGGRPPAQYIPSGLTAVLFG